MLLPAAGNPTYPAISGSVKMLYLENSYDQLTLESTVTDWYTVSYTEAEAAGGDSGFSSSALLDAALKVRSCCAFNDRAMHHHHPCVRAPSPDSC